jgi:hypothetical protein
MRRSLPVGILAVACGLFANAPVWAAAATWVSGTGSNAGSCPITAPCRTFAFALAQTDAGGSINVLSPGSFGPLTITKSVNIVSNGVEATILSGAGGAGIIVQAGASDVVSLHGLTLDLRGTANAGIFFLSGAALHLQNCMIRKATNGIDFTPASGTSRIHVADSVVADVSSSGIRIVPTGSAAVQATFDRVRVENGAGHGLVFGGGSTTGLITATVRESVSAGYSAGTGIHVEESGSGTTAVTIDRSASVNNASGIVANGAGATIRLGNSTVTGNINGLFANGGIIASYGTNKVNGNTFNGTPTSTIAMK